MRKIVLLLSVFSLMFADDGLVGKESTIPVLDLQNYFKDETRDQFIKDIREACHNGGFFALKNTKVNEEIINNLYSALETFFAFDKELKLQVNGEIIGYQRGYLPFRKEFGKGSSVGDFKEFYVVGREVSQEDADKYGCWVNVFPEFMDFRTPATMFYSHLTDYSLVIQEILSLALGEEKNFLQNICENGDTSCRMIHYPPNLTKISHENKPPWATAHTDIDAFTILPKATGEGLEVMDDEGIWHSVYVKEDAFIVNVGDFLEIFSNGYFKSALHRVMQPKTMVKDRYSSVFFVHPRSEADLSLYDALEFAKVADNNDIKLITSHRSGESIDSHISHIGIGTNSKMLKVGVVGGERIAKLNELIRLSEHDLIRGMAEV